MSETPLHDFLLPRLLQLLQDAQAAGFGREPAVAVITDIMTQPSFDDVPLPAEPAGPAPMPPPPITEEYAAPSLGSVEWIKPYGQA